MIKHTHCLIYSLFIYKYLISAFYVPHAIRGFEVISNKVEKNKTRKKSASSAFIIYSNMWYTEISELFKGMRWQSLFL